LTAVGSETAEPFPTVANTLSGTEASFWTRAGEAAWSGLPELLEPPAATAMVAATPMTITSEITIQKVVLRCRRRPLATARCARREWAAAPFPWRGTGCLVGAFLAARLVLVLLIG
jgi:hypothetical protein